MAIARTQAVSANANTVALTSTNVNDVIFVWVFNGTSATVPALVAGFTAIAQVSGGLVASRLAYKVSTGGDTTTGTWTNATIIASMVYSGVNISTPFGTTPSISTTATTTLNYPAVTLTNASGSSVILGFGAALNATAGMTGSPTGLTNRTNQTTINGCDSAPTSSNYTAATLTITSATKTAGVTLEILAAIALPELIAQPLTPSRWRK